MKSLDFEHFHVFHLGNKPYQIDFLTQMLGLKYDEAYLNRELLPLKNAHIPVLHLNDLLINKMLSSRLKDKADVEELQKIQSLRDRKSK